MATSTPNQQCAVLCQSCDNPKVIWKCILCDIKWCTDCKGKIHSRCKLQKDHKIVEIIYLQQEVLGIVNPNMNPRFTVELTNIKKYRTKLNCIKLLTGYKNDSLWIGDGNIQNGLQRLFAKPTALQKIKLQEKDTNVKLDFDITVFDIARTSTNDLLSGLLLATGESKLKHILDLDRLSEVKDSKYGVEILSIKCVHVAKDGKVIVGGDHPCSEFRKAVHTMDKYGKKLTTYEFDEKKNITLKNPKRITSTSNGNIFVLDQCGTSAVNPEHKVVILGETGVINTFEKSDANLSNCLITTPSDNVILVETDFHRLHFLNNNGQLLTSFDTSDKAIQYPMSVAVTTDGPFSVLYIGCKTPEGKSNKAKLYKMNILEY